MKTGTAVQASKLGCRKWAIAIHLLTTSLKSVSSMKMHRDLAVTQKTARHLAHRIREAYVGGKERNKHEAKKLRAGRGAVGKTAIVGMRDRDSNRIAAAVVENVKKSTLQGFVVENAAGAAAVHTDGLESFQATFKRAQQGTFHKMFRKHLQRYVSGFPGRHNNRGGDTLDRMMDIAEAMIGKRPARRHLVEGGQLDCLQDRKPEMSAKA